MQNILNLPILMNNIIKYCSLEDSLNLIKTNKKNYKNGCSIMSKHFYVKYKSNFPVHIPLTSLIISFDDIKLLYTENENILCENTFNLKLLFSNDKNTQNLITCDDICLINKIFPHLKNVKFCGHINYNSDKIETVFRNVKKLDIRFSKSIKNTHLINNIQKMFPNLKHYTSNDLPDNTFNNIKHIQYMADSSTNIVHKNMSKYSNVKTLVYNSSHHNRHILDIIINIPSLEKLLVISLGGTGNSACLLDHVILLKNKYCNMKYMSLNTSSNTIINNMNNNELYPQKIKQIFPNATVVCTDDKGNAYNLQIKN